MNWSVIAQGGLSALFVAGILWAGYKLKELVYAKKALGQAKEDVKESEDYAKAVIAQDQKLADEIRIIDSRPVVGNEPDDVLSGHAPAVSTTKPSGS